MMQRGDWKSHAADRLARSGKSKEAKELYGLNGKKRQLSEMTSSQIREEGKRRAARAKARPKSRIARLWAWLKSQS